MTAHRRTPWSAAADGPTVVLSNSLGSTHRKYNAQLADIEQRFRVVRYDTPRPPCVPVPFDPPRGRTPRRPAVAVQRSFAMVTRRHVSSSAEVVAKVDEQTTAEVFGCGWVAR